MQAGRKRKSKDEIVRPLLLWQQAVFKFLGIKAATPRAGEIQKVKNGILDQEKLKVVYESYKTVEDALYGVETGVRIGDWCDQVAKVAEEVKFPKQRWIGYFHSVRKSFGLGLLWISTDAGPAMVLGQVSEAATYGRPKEDRAQSHFTARAILRKRARFGVKRSERT